MMDGPESRTVCCAPDYVTIQVCLMLCASTSLPLAASRWIVLLSSVLLASVPCVTRGDDLPVGYRKSAERRLEAIDELCQATANTGLFSGAVLIGIDGEVVYKSGFGFANREWNNRNTTDTKFRLASVSKPFCSVVVLQLVQEGKLKLTDKIIDWLPAYRKDTGAKISIHHLLSHQSGMRDFTADYDYRTTTARLPFGKDEFIEQHCSHDLAHEPGTIYSYCNAGYIILGRIIEKVTHRTFEQNVNDRVFQPVGMVNSGFDRNRYVLPNRASGYTLSPFELENSQYMDMDSSPGAAGALYSTVEDLFLFDQALRSDVLLGSEMRRLMLTPNANVPEVKAAGGRAKSTYGYGWNIYSRSHPITGKRVRVETHGGAISGFRSMMTCLPDENVFVVLLCNQGDPPGKSQVWNSVLRLSRELLHIATSQPYQLPPKPGVSQDQRMYQLIKTGDVEKAIEWFEKHGRKQAWGGTHQSVAKQLLKEGLVREGLALMAYDVDLTPDKVWLLRTTAQAHLDYGRAKAALQYAEQGLKNKAEDARLLAIKNEAESEISRRK